MDVPMFQTVLPGKLIQIRFVTVWESRINNPFQRHAAVTYTGGNVEGNTPRIYVLRLKCVQQGQETTPIINSTGLTYYINWSTPAGCVSGEYRPTRERSGMSASSALLIIVAVCGTVYFSIGALWQFRAGERGSDLIIHRDFWCSLPSHTVAGVHFVLSWIWSFVLRVIGREDIPSGNSRPETTAQSRSKRSIITDDGASAHDASLDNPFH
eukprot:c20644_g1_i1.p2 GENE.c20644_g1_i1~~c20644_g1_i1.p2  ORF type:complete len:211 (+),score=40.48 c20644_g1_i1:1556-2188(+)